jgi:hypothetical protein
LTGLQPDADAMADWAACATLQFFRQFRFFAILRDIVWPIRVSCRGVGMGTTEKFRRKAEECMRKAAEISNRTSARLLLVKADFYLKTAEEGEAQQLSARDPQMSDDRVNVQR